MQGVNDVMNPKHRPLKNLNRYINVRCSPVVNIKFSRTQTNRIVMMDFLLGNFFKKIGQVIPPIINPIWLMLAIKKSIAP